MGVFARVKHGVATTVIAAVLFFVGSMGITYILQPIGGTLESILPYFGAVVLATLVFIYGSFVRLGLKLPVKQSVVGCLLTGVGLMGFVTVASYFNYINIVPNYRFISIAVAIGGTVFVLGLIVGERVRPYIDKDLLLTQYFVTEDSLDSDNSTNDEGDD